MSISFVVKDGVDPFSLGELSGRIKDILSMAKRQLKYNLKSKLDRSTDNDGNRLTLYVLTIEFGDSEIKDAVHKVLDHYNPKSFTAKLELSQTPKMTSEDAGFIEAIFEMNLSCANSMVRLFEFLMCLFNISDRTKEVISLIRAMKEFKFNLEFDNMKDFYSRTFATELPDRLKVINWGTLKYWAGSGLGTLLLDESTPELARDIYKSTTSNLSGLHSVQVNFSGGRAIKLLCQHFNIFELLPDIDQLKLEKDAV